MADGGPPVVGAPQLLNRLRQPHGERAPRLPCVAWSAIIICASINFLSHRVHWTNMWGRWDVMCWTDKPDVMNRNSFGTLGTCVCGAYYPQCRHHICQRTPSPACLQLAPESEPRIEVLLQRHLLPGVRNIKVGACCSSHVLLRPALLFVYVPFCVCACMCLLLDLLSPGRKLYSPAAQLPTYIAPPPP